MANFCTNTRPNSPNLSIGDVIFGANNTVQSAGPLCELLLNISKQGFSTVLFIKQNNNEASYAKKISKTEGKINWDKSAEQIIANINGLYPNPGAWFYFKKNRYKILKAEVSNNNSVPGLVVNENLEISCGSNSIKIIKIQREGKKEQNIEDFILGTKIKKGVNLKDV